MTRENAAHLAKPDLIVHTSAPLPALAAAEITPEALFFVRNHGPVPELDGAEHALEIGGLVAAPLLLTLAELRREFPQARLPATLQCAGNRRQEMARSRPIPG